MRVVTFQDMWSAVVRVLDHPSADPRLTAIVLAGLALCALIVVLILFLAFTPKQRKITKIIYYDDDEFFDAPSSIEAEEQLPERRRISGSTAAFLLSPWLIAALVAAAVIAGYLGTSTNDYCARTCHRASKVVSTAEKVEHADCVECHDSPGPGGVVGGVSDRLRMAVRYSTGVRPTSVRSTVADRSCLRCHADDVRGTRRNKATGVTMRHEEPLSAGMSCSSCHGRVGHDKGRSAVKMSSCVTCHDGVLASAECSTCHPEESAVVVENRGSERKGSGKYSYPPAQMTESGCGGCHDQARECDTCHGLRMPHGTVFLSGYHARDAAFEKKQTCWRCHEEGDCSHCHLVPFEAGHAGGWREDHKRSPRNDGCSCHNRGKTLAPGQMCAYCHGVLPKD